MNKMYIHLVSLVCLLCISAFPSNSKEKLDLYLDSFVNDKKTPGIQYMVLNEDSVLFSHASGLSDISNQRPMTLDNSMMLYSVTKVFTATAIMQLVQNGKLSLDDSLREILPWVPYHTTIRLMLCHSSGIPEVQIGNFFIHQEKDQANFNRLAILKATCKKNPKIIYQPGSKTKYSNLAFALLGEVIEAKSGETYEEYVTKNIFRPIGIDSNEISFSYSTSDVLSKGYIRKHSFFNATINYFVKGYTAETNGKWKTFKENWYINCPAHGGAIGRISGLSKYLRDMTSVHSKILSDSTRSLLFTIQRPFKSSFIGSTDIALAWFYNRNSENPYFFHVGSAFGYVTEIRIYPAKRIMSITSVNTTDKITKKIMDKIDRNFLSLTPNSSTRLLKQIAKPNHAP